MDEGSSRRGLRALREGRAAVDLAAWRKVLVSGPEAEPWLNDLASADLAGLEPGEARRSLLLSPTGHLRADFTAARLDEGFLLVQDHRQPEPVDRLLAPYVLSAEVRLEDRTADLRLVALPAEPPPAVRPPPGWRPYRPSCLGGGLDLVGDAGAPPPPIPEGWVRASLDDLETWRIERGLPRFPADLGPTSLPHEAGLDGSIAYAKGCFLGQEAAARVRNLGHPPFVVLALRADGPAAPGEAVMGDGRAVGEVTSAVPLGEGTALLARVRWAARGLPLSTASGVRLFPSAAAAPG